MMVADWAGYQRFRDGFAEIIDERFYSLEWVERRILNGSLVVLATDKGAVLLEINVYPTGLRELHGMAATGDLGEIVDVLIPMAEAWGFERGCVSATIESREGWGKLLKPAGYEIYQTTIKKELSDGL
jgi:hypothetical protein